MIQLTNYLAKHNRYYSYHFRNLSCVADGACAFPEPGEPFRLGVVPRMLRGIVRAALKATAALFALASAAQAVNWAGRAAVAYVIKGQRLQGTAGGLLERLLVKPSNCDEITF